MFNTAVPVSFTGATGPITTLTKFISGLNFIAAGTGVTVTLYQGYIAQPGTGTATLVLTGTGNVDNAAHKYWARYTDFLTGTVDSAVSASVTNDSTHKQNTLAIPAPPIGTRSIDIYRIEGAGSVTGQKLTGVTVSGGVTPYASGAFTITDNVATASLGATGQIVTGTTNTTGQFLGAWFANAGAAPESEFALPISINPLAGAVTILTSGTGTVTGTLRGR